MELYNSPAEYMYNLKVVQSTEAKRLWRKSVKEQWDNECAYCGSTDDLTIDHIIPRSKGGNNSLENCALACREANQAKSDLSLEEFIDLCQAVVDKHKNR